MKYYAVKVGKEVGVFNNWNDCQRVTAGFPNADFKSFSNQDEAEAYIDGIDIYLEKVKTDIDQGYVVAFCDGSYDRIKNCYSYGVLLIDKNLAESELCGHAANPKYVSSKNIMGEILGTIFALDWAISNGYSKIKVYHDYEGLSKWASGEWKADCEAAKMFVGVLNGKYSELIEVTYEKVTSHSNNKYNDKADSLAKNALIDRTTTAIQGDNWYAIPHIEDGEIQAILDLITEENTNILVSGEQTADRNVFRMTLDTEKLTITHYKTGKRKLLVQGSKSLLFQIFISYISDLLGIENIDAVCSTANRTSINSRKITDDFEALFPNLPTDYPENIKKLIRQSIINLSYFFDMCEDYSQYVFPSLRALEGHMKYVFLNNGITIVSRNGFGIFDRDNSTGVYTLQAAYSNQIKNPDTVFKLEKYYNYYNKTRHTLFHFGDIIGSTDSTRIIETKDDANDLIKECIELIRE